jgi:hypothetical protein
MVFTLDYVPNTLIMGVVAIDNHMTVPAIEIDINVIENIMVNGRLKVNVIPKELKSKL